MTLAADMGGVVIPTAIMGLNALVILLAVLVHRHKGRREEPVAEPERVSPAADVEGWQREHGHAVDRWMQDRQRMIAAARSGERPVPQPDTVLLAGADQAIGACPDDELRSTLTAMRAAGEAAVSAFARDRAGDGEEASAAFERQRDACADRLRQLQVG